MALNWRSLGTAVGLDLIVVVIVFMVFNYVRRNTITSDFYAAKRKLSIPFRCACLARGRAVPGRAELRAQNF